MLEITEPGYQDFRRDASCIVRPQNLIGERFVECKPTQPRSATAEAPPALQQIDDGPGKGQYLLPVTNTMQTVDIDLIGNTMREPERERLSLILNELGTGVAGRGKDLNEVIRRANPALQETDKVLEILARQNTQLEQLAVNSDTVLAPLARDRTQVASAIRNTSEVAKATAEKRAALADDIQTLPRFLDELEPTMVRLGSLADQTTPVLTDLHARAGDINNIVRRLGPFSQAAIPAVDSLGEASKTGTQAVIDARPVIADLRALAKEVRPVGKTLREVLESFRDTGGIERLMDYIFYQAAAVNGFDAVGHYLRAGLIVNQCATYAQTPVAGCSAKFPVADASASGATAKTASAIDAAGDDPVLRATAIALARALGQEIEKAKKRDGGREAAEGRTEGEAQARQEQAARGQAAGVRADGRAGPAGPVRRAAGIRADGRARPAGPARGADGHGGSGRHDHADPRRRTRRTRCWTTCSARTADENARRRHRGQPRADRRRHGAGDPGRGLPVLQRQQGPAVRPDLPGQRRGPQRRPAGRRQRRQDRRHARRRGHGDQAQDRRTTAA